MLTQGQIKMANSCDSGSKYGVLRLIVTIQVLFREVMRQRDRVSIEVGPEKLMSQTVFSLYSLNSLVFYVLKATKYVFMDRKQIIKIKS